MQRSEFITEQKQDVTSQDFIYLRNLYTPIVGQNAILLYSLLTDYHCINKVNTSYIPTLDLARIMNITEETLIKERKKLEAIGLIRVFENANNNSLIILINKPLDPANFKKNSLLYREFVRKMGEIMFERIEFSFKGKEYVKDEFKEVTAKFQDLFDVNVQNQDNVQNTLEIPSIEIKNREEAMQVLNCFQFVKYLTTNSVSPSQLSIFQSLMNLGFSNQSLNIIIDYSYETNGKIVANHIKSIAEDLFKKEIKDISSIKLEIDNARESKKVFIKRNNFSNQVIESKSDDTDWDAFWKSFGGI